jgi:hypothetical protein
MWLLYLQFDDKGQILVWHVRCRLKRDAEAVLQMARQHGLTVTATLTEYALFRAGLTIQGYWIKNDRYLMDDDFRRLWQRVEQERDAPTS